MKPLKKLSKFIDHNKDKNTWYLRSKLIRKNGLIQLEFASYDVCMTAYTAIERKINRNIDHHRISEYYRMSLYTGKSFK